MHTTGRGRPALLTRRGFIGGAAALAVPTGMATADWLRDDAPQLPEPPPVAPDDERFWSRVQSEFVLDRSALYFNCAGFAPATQVTLESMLTDTAFRNRLPARHLWTVLEPRLEAVRAQVAAAFGCDPEELALTRNATEAMEIVQMGLDLRAGDEVLTTDQDFFRMLNAWDQRVRRDGITLRKIPVPTPAGQPSDLTEAIERAITPRTRVIMFCHVTNVTGQIYPVRQICEMARARGILTLVDGAQAFGHVPVWCDELGCDYYAGSLHKYTLAPLGTGFLRVRRDLIPALWPLTPAAPSRRENIRKFEDIGTHPAAAHNAVSEALRHRRSVGQANVTARLRYLTLRWVSGLAHQPRITFFNRFEPAHTCGIATVGIDGMEPQSLVKALWDRFHIVVRPVSHPDCSGVRVSPHIYNSVDEVDRFVAAMTTLTTERRS